MSNSITENLFEYRSINLPDELNPLVELWNICLPESMSTVPELLRNYLDNDKNYDPEGSIGAYTNENEMVGWIIGRRWQISIEEMGGNKEDQENRDKQMGIGMIFVHPNYRRKGIGTKLVQIVEEFFAKNGGQIISIGREPGNYFLPGVPEELDETMEFFDTFGYGESGISSSIDIIGDISYYEEIPINNPKLAEYIRKNKADGYEVIAYSNDLKEKMRDYMHTTFGNHWYWKVNNHIICPEAAMDEIQILIRKNPSGVQEFLGFALTSSVSSMKTAAATLVQSKGDPIFGGLGPIGISDSIRGRALGAMLLHCALYNLKRKGVKKVLIDWTSHGLLKRFYGPAGFKLYMTYISGSKTLTR
jgi:GNAT superfamily N-acetyltransferase